MIDWYETQKKIRGEKPTLSTEGLSTESSKLNLPEQQTRQTESFGTALGGLLLIAAGIIATVRFLK
jgi:hypothetical protein